MARFSLLLIVPLLLLATPASAEVVLPLPPSAYPAGTEYSYLANPSNYHMTCSWGFSGCVDEGGSPFLHASDEATLGRVSGWAQTGDLIVPGHPGKQMHFMLWFSTYTTATQAAAALADLTAQSAVSGFAPRQTPMVAAPSGGAAMTSVYRQPGIHAWLIGAQIGTTEIEAGGTDVKTKWDATVKKYLALQVAAALALALAP